VKLPRRFFVVAHTHWDREWYRPFEHFRLWLGHVVDGVLDTLERDDSFHSFTLDGQAIVLEDYLDVRPENEPRLRALLGAGRIEIGPSYVLPDELLVGPEALVRNLLLGRRVCERFDTEPTAVGYLPDSFGHPLQMPQILCGFGVRNCVFSRGMGDQLDETGVVFRWRSPDGSEVLALQQLPHYGNFARIADADDAEQRVRGIVDQFGSMLERAGVEDVLLCNGSDHLPIQPELPAICKELEARLPGSEVTISSYAAYVQAIGQPEVPSWTGELLGSRIQNILRGVNSSRLYLKQANERAERQLLGVETLAALHALRLGEPFPTDDFTLAWRELLRNHPHDSICGCSCDEVHRDMIVRYEALHRMLAEIVQWSLAGLVEDDAEGMTTVVNPLPYPRRGLVELAGAEPLMVELEGFAARTIEPRATAAPPVPSPDGRVESERFVLEATPDGTLTLTDKPTGRRYERLHALEDEPDMGDLYNFCPVEGAPVWRSSRARSRVLAQGPPVWELELEFEAERPAALDRDETVTLRLVTVARLVEGSGRVEFRTTIDNPACDHRLRAVFRAGPSDGTVRAESAFALVHRPLTTPPRTDWAEPPDATQHTGGAVALGPLALITRGLPEYEARRGRVGHELCLTLLRCVGTISKPTGALSTRPLGAGPDLPTPEGQCLGRHELEYALRVDASELDDVQLLRESQDYRRGFLLIAGAAAALHPPFTLEGDVVFSCLKGAEDGDGFILRCFNPAASGATARITGPVSVSRTRLDETEDEPVPDGVIEAGRYEIATLRLRPR
jgi:mannosylglycerate hydrolase